DRWVLEAHDANDGHPSLLRARRQRPCCRAAERDYEFSPSDVDCHPALSARGHAYAIEERYHALARKKQMLLRCESLKSQMSQMGQRPKNSHRAYVFRFTPLSGLWWQQSIGPNRAISGRIPSRASFHFRERFHDSKGGLDEQLR